MSIAVPFSSLLFFSSLFFPLFLHIFFCFLFSTFCPSLLSFFLYLQLFSFSLHSLCLHALTSIATLTYITQHDSLYISDLLSTLALTLLVQLLAPTTSPFLHTVTSVCAFSSASPAVYMPSLSFNLLLQFLFLSLSFHFFSLSLSPFPPPILPSSFIFFPSFFLGNTLYAQLKSKWIHPTPRSGVVLVTEDVSATIKKTLVNFDTLRNARGVGGGVRGALQLHKNLLATLCPRPYQNVIITI